MQIKYPRQLLKNQKNLSLTALQKNKKNFCNSLKSLYMIFNISELHGIRRFDLYYYCNICSSVVA